MLENPGQSNHDLRVTAFIAYMEEHFPDMKLVGRQASNQDSNKAYQAVQAMLQANPNLGALWIPEAGSAEGAVAAVLEAKADVLIMHADVTPTTLEHIKAGNIHMALNPNQGMQGYMGFLATFMAAHPDLIDPFNDYKTSGYNPMGIPFIDNGFAVITKENADDFDLERLHGRPRLSRSRSRRPSPPAGGGPTATVAHGRNRCEGADHVRRRSSSKSRTSASRSARSRRCAASTSSCAAARSTPSPARTAPASRR